MDKETYYVPYEGRDLKILDDHANGTVAEDIESFDSQLENHFAHVIMLAEQGIISKKDAADIMKALLEIKEMGPERIEMRPGLTDLFSNIQEWLIDRLGIEVGGKIHTGRSRNDMNSTIERQHVRETILDVCEAMTLLMKTLLVQAEEHKNTVIPGYTHHSQQAQPITLGHFYTGCFQMFQRDLDRILESYARVNQSTMGGAAIATTSFDLDRERVAELLGFDSVMINSMDAIAAVDFAYEPAAAMAIYLSNVGRMCESLLLWNMNEVGISRLALPYCSYSTIMPQKRNPVALETLRGSGEKTFGILQEMLTTMKAYPLGNGREPGFVVSGYYRIAQLTLDSTYLLEGIVRTLEVDRERALKVTADGFSTVTDLADKMVMSYSLSFSAAKAIVGRVVVNADKEKRSVHAIDSEFIDRAAQEVLNISVGMSEEDIKNALDPVENVMRRSLPGGPSPVCVQAMIDSGFEYLDGKEKEWRGKRDLLAATKKKLFETADQMIREAE
ncbi:MAG: argininosuccinate lyase [Clostridia bacterium]|nr:argininosuccinate lyase [Clostridia bacterium]